MCEFYLLKDDLKSQCLVIFFSGRVMCLSNALVNNAVSVFSFFSNFIQWNSIIVVSLV